MRSLGLNSASTKYKRFQNIVHSDLSLLLKDKPTSNLAEKVIHLRWESDAHGLVLYSSYNVLNPVSEHRLTS